MTRLPVPIDQPSSFLSSNNNRLYHLGNPVKILALLVIWVVSLCFFLKSGYALEQDALQPIEVSADSAEISETTQIATYAGNVELSQGSLRILCDTLTIYNSAEGVERVKAVGRPARYQQRLELSKPIVKATGNTLDYSFLLQQFTLIGAGKIVQGGHIFEGERIEYDLARQVLKATGEIRNEGEGKSSAFNSGRVKMILQPRSSQE